MCMANTKALLKVRVRGISDETIPSRIIQTSVFSLESVAGSTTHWGRRRVSETSLAKHRRMTFPVAAAPYRACGG